MTYTTALEIIDRHLGDLWVNDGLICFVIKVGGPDSKQAVECGNVVITIADNPYTGEGPQEVRIRALDCSWRVSAPIADLDRLVEAARVFVGVAP